MNKTAVAGLFVYKRSSYFNSIGNKQPLQTISATTYMGAVSAPPNLTNVTNFSPISPTAGPQYGFDYRTADLPIETTGMPTTAQLQPYMVLSFGNGVGTRGTTASDAFTTAPTGANPPTVNDTYHFPEGAYPGQIVNLVVDNYAFSGTFTEGTPAVSFNPYWWGTIRINIPFKRTSSTTSGAGGLSTKSWYAVNDWVSGSINDGKRNFYQVVNTTDYADAVENNTKSTVISMIWDGGVQRTWTLNDFIMIPPGETGRLGYIQYGWRILSTTTADASRILNPQ